MSSPPRRLERVFVLSPASLSGARGRRILAGETGGGLLAERLSHGGSVPLSEVYASISSLYFRGKLAYARRFARRAGEGPGVLTITPNRGLVPCDQPFARADLRALAGTDIDPTEPRYLDPLLATARAVARDLRPGADVVLLGSIATGKYVDPLSSVFGRLLIPRSFIGRGDMSRGGLLLRAVAADEELEYVVALDAPRRGTRPPRLGP